MIPAECHCFVCKGGVLLLSLDKFCWQNFEQNQGFFTCTAGRQNKTFYEQNISKPIPLLREFYVGMEVNLTGPKCINKTRGAA